MRYLFHLVRSEEVRFRGDARYCPPSFEREGFVHASFSDRVHESARLYFPEGARPDVMVIDPRRLDVPVEVVATPRGPMPHVLGPIPGDAVRMTNLDAELPDVVTGARIGICAFEEMTLLDLVGPFDALSRIASMGFDPSSSCEIVALSRAPEERTAGDFVVWRGGGATLAAASYRPAFDAFDVLVVPGGPSVRRLADDPSLLPYLASYPDNRLLASVCTGALLLGLAGRLRGRRATTHASALGELAGFGATALPERVVDDGNLVTSAGVTAGIDLGLHLVERLHGPEVAGAIAARMEARRA